MKSTAVIAALLALGFVAPASAQQYIRIPTCGTASPAPGVSQGYMDANGNICGSVTGTITTTPSPSVTTNSSTTITVGGTFQQIAAASSTRKSVEFQNLCDKSGACTTTANYCYLFFAASGTPTAGTNTIRLAPGANYLRSSGAIPSDAVQATCDGTGDHFYLAVE